MPPAPGKERSGPALATAEFEPVPDFIAAIVQALLPPLSKRRPPRGCRELATPLRRPGALRRSLRKVSISKMGS